MKREQDERTQGSWLQRARAESADGWSVATASDSAVDASAVELDRGWDPYEVWLRRIREPQERRYGTLR